MILAQLSFHHVGLVKLAIVVGVFIALTCVFLAVTRIVLRWIGRLTSSHRGSMDALLHALAPALKMGSIVAAMVVALRVEPIPARWDTVIGALLSAGTVLALIVFADGLLTFWMERAAVQFPLLGHSYGLITGALRGLVFGLGILMFLDTIGISIGPILATLGIGSLAIALALQETVKNTLSGFLCRDRQAARGRRLCEAVDRPGGMVDAARVAQQQVSNDERQYRRRAQLAVSRRHPDQPART
jgi:small-conductance mechanosensitive channel